MENVLTLSMMLTVVALYTNCVLQNVLTLTMMFTVSVLWQNTIKKESLHLSATAGNWNVISGMFRSH